MDSFPRSNTNPYCFQGPTQTPNTGPPNGDHTSKYIIVTIYNSKYIIQYIMVLIYCGLTSKVQLRHKSPILGPMEITPVST